MNPVVDRRLDLDLWRRSSDRVVAGVAGALADRFGVAAGYVRAAFVVTAALWGLGLLVYLVLWMVTFDAVEDRPARSTLAHQRAGLAAIFGGFLLLFRGVGWWPSDLVMVMAATLAFGLAVLGDYDWVARIFDPEGARPSKWRVAGGLILLVAGLGLFAGSVSQVRTLGTVATAVIVTVVGVGLVFGPWLVSLGRELGAERRERVRQEERAEMAAHLHDSVLQTLALMQRTDDPKRMVTLARQQERELRSWLYGARSLSGEIRLTEALEQAAARIESDFTVPVEVVTVGDAPDVEATRALVAAAGEAIVNAAKHSGAGEVSVYSEVANGRAEVWVADLGVGFDRADVPPDRRGLVDSIEGRLRRVGDAPDVEATRALVAAAGEAIVNAAKHSGAGEVSVYSEVANGRAEVWVADLGVGFDRADVPPDRRGLVDSIEGRLRRVGGGADVDSRIGDGTEVHLWVPLEANGRGAS